MKLIRKRPVFEVSGGGDCWHWHLVTPNGAVIAASAKPYTRRRDCLRAIDTVLLAIFDADIEVVQ